MIFVFVKLILNNLLIHLYVLMRNDKISISISFTITSKWQISIFSIILIFKRNYIHISFSLSDSKLIDLKLFDKYSSRDNTRNDDRLISWIYLRRDLRDASMKIRREMIFDSSIWSSSLVLLWISSNLWYSHLIWLSLSLSLSFSFSLFRVIDSIL